MRSIHSTISGFTLIELLVVISIIGLLGSIVISSVGPARERGKAAQAAAVSDSFRKAIELYNDQMGFYPPDLGRGWDPGLTRALPWNPDTDQTSIPACAHCPSSWDTIVSQRWNGPYLQSWPKETPWGGKYDFNYWPSGATRYGCPVPAGVFVGVQRDYNDEKPISAVAEQWLLDRRVDGDGCLNGEAQVILFRL